uniref:Protein BYPASS-related n=1 Tax=Kalanchoe fedtschenkoi TaxID=63787 RepID=A0A7N0VF71_KALFE
MPATEYQGSFLGRISIRRNQVSSLENNQEQELEDLELFQRHISDRFADLIVPAPDDPPASPHHHHHQPNPDNVLSISWLRKLLDAFLCCEAEFKAVLIMGRDPAHVAKPPLDRLIPELMDRVVRALDLCNAITHGVDSVMQCQRLAEIAASALERRPFGEGQVKRAKRALTTLLSLMDDKENTNSSFKAAERNWSFGRRGSGAAGANKDPHMANFRCLTMSVSKNWSASKQIQAMMGNLAAPRGNEASGLAVPVYIMSSVIVFAMWALVAAIPCHERSGLSTHFPVPRQLSWAQSMIGLQERIAEDWKKKEKKGSAGLMEEMQKMEKLGTALVDFADGFQFPAEAEKEEVAAGQVCELVEVCRRLDEGLLPLQQQIREVFHRMVRSRTEILELLDQASKAAANPVA